MSVYPPIADVMGAIACGRDVPIRDVSARSMGSSIDLQLRAPLAMATRR